MTILTKDAPKNFLFLILFGSIPAYTWSLLAVGLYKLRMKWKESKMFHDRHNCVVMFSQERGITGYPHWKKSKTDITKNICEPLLYFIRTAEKSIDIATMVISSDVIIEELANASTRGVQIRLLLDFNYGAESIRKLSNIGVAIAFYVCPYPGASSIMHYKYAVKDYSEGKGYMCLGSLNWVTNSLLNNYENLTFSTEPSMIDNFHRNFEESWNTIHTLNRDNYNIRATLHEAAYL